MTPRDIERACYRRHLFGESWSAIGADYWPEEPCPLGEHEDDRGAWYALKASCAASRYAHRCNSTGQHRPWPLEVSRDAEAARRLARRKVANPGLTYTALAVEEGIDPALIREWVRYYTAQGEE